MKYKFYTFLSLLITLAVIAVIAVGYVNGSQIWATIVESNARIAEAQPNIIIAEGQKQISMSLAHQNNVMTWQNVFLSFVPWVALTLYILKDAVVFTVKLALKDKPEVETCLDSEPPE